MSFLPENSVKITKKHQKSSDASDVSGADADNDATAEGKTSYVVTRLPQCRH